MERPSRCRKAQPCRAPSADSEPGDLAGWVLFQPRVCGCDPERHATYSCPPCAGPGGRSRPRHLGRSRPQCRPHLPPVTPTRVWEETPGAWGGYGRRLSPWGQRADCGQTTPVTSPLERALPGGLREPPASQPRRCCRCDQSRSRRSGPGGPDKALPARGRCGRGAGAYDSPRAQPAAPGSGPAAAERVLPASEQLNQLPPAPPHPGLKVGSFEHFLPESVGQFQGGPVVLTESKALPLSPVERPGGGGELLGCASWWRERGAAPTAGPAPGPRAALGCVPVCSAAPMRRPPPPPQLREGKRFRALAFSAFLSICV